MLTPLLEQAQVFSWSVNSVGVLTYVLVQAQVFSWSVNCRLFLLRYKLCKPGLSAG